MLSNLNPSKKLLIKHPVGTTGKLSMAEPKTVTVNESVVEEIYNTIATAYDKHMSQKRNQWRLVEYPYIEKLKGDIENKVVLDAGCGNGVFIHEVASEFNPLKIVGLDISKKMVEIARKKTKELENVRIIKGSVQKLPFDQNTFDTIFSFNTLHYIQDISSVFVELHRVLKPGGRLIFSVRHPIRNLTFKAKIGKGNYFSKGWYKEKWPGTNNIEIYSYYRPLEEWVNIPLKSGFTLIALYETKPESKIKIEYPDFYNNFTRIPREVLFILQNKE